MKINLSNPQKMQILHGWGTSACWWSQYCSEPETQDKIVSLLYGSDSLVEHNLELIRRLMRLEKIEKIDQPRGLRLAATNRETWLDIDSDTLYQHQANLELRLVNARKRLDGLNARLANESYLAKAPERLVTETKEEQQTTEKLIDRLVTELEVIQL